MVAGPDGTEYVPVIQTTGAYLVPADMFPLLDAYELALYEGEANDLGSQPNQDQPDLPLAPPE